MTLEVRPTRQFAASPGQHREKMIASLALPIDNGLAEAMNASAKATSMRARG
ncbi:MAG: transposase [bacterium]|nr:transposase [candidate division KSB1 bacterium]MDH7561497.1 transposase [bacterium]